MGNTYISCDLTKFNSSKFKCYTQSGNKKVYEDDGLTKGQSFIIFPIKTTLSTGECEYTMGLTGQLEDNYPWKSWSYSGYPNDAVPGNTYSYTIKGLPMVLSNYKGVTVTGIPSKTWSWDIESIKEVWLYANVSTDQLLLVFLKFGGNEYLGNDILNIMVQITGNNPDYNNPDSLTDSVSFIVSKNSKAPLVERINLRPKRNWVYSAEIILCRPMEGKNYRVKLYRV